MKKLLNLVLCGIALTGCAGLHYLETTQTVSLDRGNFKMIRQVEGKEVSVYILGIGGMSPWAIKANAINDMINNAQLKENQAIAYINLRTNKHYILGPVAATYTTVASGWVVEFTDGVKTAQPNPVNSDMSIAQTPLRIEPQKIDISENEDIKEIEEAQPQEEMPKDILVRKDGETFKLVISDNRYDNARMAWDAYSFLTKKPYDTNITNYQILKDYCKNAGVKNASLFSKINYYMSKCK